MDFFRSNSNDHFLYYVTYLFNIFYFVFCAMDFCLVKFECSMGLDRDVFVGISRGRGPEGERGKDAPRAPRIRKYL